MESSTQRSIPGHITSILALNQNSQINAENLLDQANSFIFQDFAQNGNYDRNEQNFQDPENVYPELSQRFEEAMEDTEIIPSEVSLEGNLPMPSDFRKAIFSSKKLIVKILRIDPMPLVSKIGDDFKQMKVQALKNGDIVEFFVYFFKRDMKHLSNFRQGRIYTLYGCQPMPNNSPNYKWTKDSIYEENQAEKDLLMIFNALSSDLPSKEITFTRAKVSLCKRGQKYSITYRACGKIDCRKALTEIDGDLFCLDCVKANPSVAYRFVFDIIIQPLAYDERLPDWMVATVWDTQASTMINSFSAGDFRNLDARIQERVIESVESKEYYIVLANERTEDKATVKYIARL